MRSLKAPDNEMPAPLARLFCGHVIHKGDGMIKLDLPPIVESGATTPVSVKVDWTVVMTKAVARLYLLADSNAVPLLARITLVPDIVPPHLLLDVRLERSTHLRAVVQCGDGTALQVERWVWVTPRPGIAEAPGRPSLATWTDHGSRARRPGEGMYLFEPSRSRRHPRGSSRVRPGVPLSGVVADVS